MKRTWIAAVAARARRSGGRRSERVELAGGLGALRRRARRRAGRRGLHGHRHAAAAVAAVAAAGGTVANDLSKQIGVLVVESSVGGLRDALSSSALVETVGQDKKFKGLPDGGPEQTADPLEPLQWDMAMIRAPQAHNFQAGSRSVDVGILDSGIDGRHPDFIVDGSGSNVDCARGRNSVSFLPSGPGVGQPRSVHGQPVPRHARRRNGRRAGERDRRRRRRPERDARPGEGLRRERLLLRQRRRRRAHLRGRHQARRDQHELLRRRRRVPGVDRVQVQLRPDAAGVPAVGRAGDQVRDRPRRRAGRGARQLGRGSRQPVGGRRGRLRRRPRRDARA